MRVLLGDDQQDVRSALLLLLAQEAAFEVVGEAADATGLLRAVTETEPHLLLLDWELPGLPITQLLRLLHYERPSLKIVAMSSRPEAKQQALENGIHAFLSKNAAPDRVLATIKTLL